MKIFLIIVLIGGIGISFSYFNRDSDTTLELIEAVKANDISLTRQVLSKKCDPNQRGLDGESAIFHSVGNDNLEITRLLIASGSTVNLEDKNGKTPLFVAVENSGQTTDVVTILLNNGADINHRDRYGRNALFLSVDVNGSLNKTELLLNHGIHVNVQSYDEGDFPLRIAVSWQAEKSVRLLLERGADPNLAMMDGRTALKESQRSKSDAISGLLLEFGASR